MFLTFDGWTYAPPPPESRAWTLDSRPPHHAREHRQQAKGDHRQKQPGHGLCHGSAWRVPYAVQQFGLVFGVRSMCRREAPQCITMVVARLVTFVGHAQTAVQPPVPPFPTESSHRSRHHRIHSGGGKHKHQLLTNHRTRDRRTHACAIRMCDACPSTRLVEYRRTTANFRGVEDTQERSRHGQIAL